MGAHESADAAGTSRAEAARRALMDEAARYRPRSRPRRSVDDDRSFAASLGWAALGTILPGAGLLRTRWRPLGAAMLGTLLALGSVIGVIALFAPTLLMSVIALPGALTVAWVAIALYVPLWVISILATHLMLRPTPPQAWQRAVGAVVVGLLSLAVAAPTFTGARSLYDTEQLISGVLGQDNGSHDFGHALDPWANKERVNVLVLGGDAGADRTGTRTDTVILASIDTRTGDMILFSLPRQTQRMPFPPGSALAHRWPFGFTNGVPNDMEFALNSIYGNVPAMAPELFGAGVEDPGAEALKQAVGEALGLKVDFYAMVNLDGFVELINALGGITVNINQPVPVGGKNRSGNVPAVPPDRWLPPGPDQHLDGYDALWFARGRYGAERGDYERMARQRCVIQAVVGQADPTTIAANYEALTKAGRAIVATDVPTRQLPAMLTLALKVKDGAMTSLSFENDKDGFSTVNPDWNLVRQRVRDAIHPPAHPPAPPATEAPATEDPATVPEPSESAEPTAAPEPSSVVDECAYNPVPLHQDSTEGTEE